MNPKCQKFCSRDNIVCLVAGVLISIFAILAIVIVVSAGKKSEQNNLKQSFWGYTCQDNKCLKVPATNLTTSLPLCYLGCYEAGTLWPYPSGEFSIGQKFVEINNFEFEFPNYSNQNEFWLATRERFEQQIQSKMPHHKLRELSGNSVIIKFKVQYDSLKLDLETDETSQLTINWAGEIVEILIESVTYFGARHALESVSQLLQFDEYLGVLLIPSNAQISDGPVYKHRGIMLDTSRQYYPVDAIKRTIDVMAIVKLNVLHWHIIDAESFPLHLKSHPELSEIGAYSRSKTYNAEDVKNIIQYGRHRGVIILPEFDAPAHVGEGWQFTEVVNCFKFQPWMNYCVGPPCGQFDVTQDKVYEYLDDIYKEFNNIFEIPERFHMGGDEVSFRCWNSSTTITDWMKEKGWQVGNADFLRLWEYFQTRAFDIWAKYSDSDVIIWESSLTALDNVENILDPNKYIIQAWETNPSTTDLLESLLKKGYRMIVSNANPFYLDCGLGGWIDDGVAWCSPYNTWGNIYDFDISQGFGDYSSQFLGAEVCLWSSINDQAVMDSRIWPRASALAERLWANPKKTYKEADARIIFHREMLVQYGIQADSIQSEWCLLNQAECPASY